ncbi:contractile injection system protein, VgrG/Pvc8 family [Halodesulfovibrio aestuarii]|uniref:contractile injection system protein, VgrG/Pvc8 family n=1 Tax=Halodesulfovibrio aestuarii TaxID=126333 RepID=UPI003D32D8BC
MSDSGIALPDSGAELTVYMGYRDKLRLMGKYVVDEVSLSFPPDSMTISANAAPLDKSNSGFTPLQSQKSRSFPAGTISDLVSTIAKEHNLAPAVAPSLAQVPLPHINQVDESDMNVLTRVAKEHDAIAKANGGKLLFVERGEGKNTKGKQMPTITLTKQQVTSGSVKLSQRQAYKSVVATYRDTAAARDIEVTAGAGEPVYRLKGMYADKNVATTAVQKRLKAFVRGKSTLSLSLPFMPDLVAESRLVLQEFRTGIDGKWSVTKATHTMNSSGGVTSVEGEVVI